MTKRKTWLGLNKMLSQRSILLWSPQQHRVCIPHLCWDRKDPDSPGPIPYNFFLRNLQKNCRKLQNFDKLNGKFQSKIDYIYKWIIDFNEEIFGQFVALRHVGVFWVWWIWPFNRKRYFFKTPKVHISLMCDVKFFLLKNNRNFNHFL